MKTLAEKNALAAEAMPKVERIIYAMAKRIGNDVDVEEIRSHALTGLAQAIETFDADRKVPISKFVVKRVEGQILDGMSQNRMLPRRLQRQIAFLKRSQEMLKYEQQNPPPKDKVETVHRLADRLKDLATAYVTSCSGEQEEHLESPHTPDAETLLESKQYYHKVRSAISSLPPKYQRIVQAHFYEDISLRQIAAEFNKSPSWACRNLQAALMLMRRQFK